MVLVILQNNPISVPLVTPYSRLLGDDESLEIV